MIRLTKRVFTDLAIWMIGFGMFVGVIFPFFTVLLGMDRSLAYTWWFFCVCILAGLFVGAFNILLAKSIVGGRLVLLSRQMQKVENHLKAVAGKNEIMDCTPKECHLPVDSDDSIGLSSKAFNTLVDTLGSSLQLEMQMRTYTSMLTSYLETRELCQHALTSLMEIFNFSGGAILVEKGGALQVEVFMGLVSSKNLTDNAMVLTSLQTLKARLIDIPDFIQVDGVLTTFRPVKVLIQPIVYKQLALGVMVLATSEALLPEKAGNIDLFSSSFALALHNAVTHDQVQQLAAVDPLTGIYNRRFGLTRLHEEFIRTVKQNGAIGLLMLDVDRFKQINDTYGHTIGDRVLQAIASTARNQLREGDIIVRLGGDEFMMVLLGANRDDTLEVGESIRRSIEEKRIIYGNQEIRITVSIGGASFPEHDANHEEELIEVADQALYLVKESGRNRVSL
ncbi:MULTISPECIES: sensor domain-containing diguanylate cyclase [unclassified Sphaerochaeta]|jgi:diguanylate cyclase (GGDEF)-like protein|uniref:sensor domain-containing diguanylate cyclase n=1 Tax=unclassified Sphaerochaeta TaxID=2637943 RepID=UPI0025D3171A|nr:sensor domain-containing diguanylate cyclase [Sphaerochaeta sp. UBA5856]